MKVTNEQAQLDIAKYLYHSETKKTVSPLIKKNYAYAADLLEARDFIKEMREEINLTLRDFEKVDEVCRIANVMPFSLTKRKLAELLEKSKDYAERPPQNSPSPSTDATAGRFRKSEKR